MAALVGLLTRRYRHLRREERVSLFADLVGSTALAERLGASRYQSFLNRAFGEIAEQVERHAGAIYRYVGDAVVVTWPLEADDVRAGNCFRSAQAILDALEAAAASYVSDFGAAPRFRLALHYGPVLAAEIGELPRKILYSGHTLRATARMEAIAKRGGHTIVASEHLLNRTPLPNGLRAQSLSSRTFQDKRVEHALVSIESRG